MRVKTRFVAVLVSLAALLAAQEFRATVTGHVGDTTGAVIPNVTVEIANMGTNEVTRSVTTAEGVYTLPFLIPGQYRLTATSPGFKSYVRTGIVLNVGDALGIDIQMEIGQASESITVAANALQLQTESADRGLVLDQTAIAELPLNARNPYMLSNLSAGVTYNGSLMYQRPFDNGAIADWAINGGLDRTNEFLLDGAPNNAQAGANNIAFVVPVDSTQEMKIQTNTYDAAYGKTGGGVMNVTTKNGANQYHGTGYEFMRRNALDANSFQNNSTGSPKSGHLLDQYGGSIGGPITLPKIYNGHDRSFFFFNYEGYREDTPAPLTVSVPTAAELGGDFSALVNSAGNKIAIYDPASTIINGTTVTRTQFPNNTIPASRLSPIALSIAKLWPAANTTTPGSGYSQSNLLVPGGVNPTHDDFYNTVDRFDQNFGPSNHLFFRNGSNDRTEYNSRNGLTGEGYSGSDPLKRINDAYALDWVSTISPTLVTDARISYSRYVEGTRTDFNKGSPTQFGFPQSLVSELPVPDYIGSYSVSGPSGYSYTGIGAAPFNFNYTNSASAAASVTKVLGKQTLKAGVDIRRIQYDLRNYGNNFSWTFGAGWTQQQYNIASASSGNGLASFLMGLPTAGSVDNNARPSYVYRYDAFYLQDDWKVTRRLTLNLGIRYDVYPALTERYSRLTNGFSTATNPINTAVQAAQPGFPTVTGGLQFVQPGNGNSNVDWTGIQGRFGMAYQISQKLVFRGGWGRYMLDPTNDDMLSSGYSITTSMVTSVNNSETPILQNSAANPNGIMSNPYPSGILQPSGSSMGLESLMGSSIGYFTRNFRLPYVAMFSAGFQYELPWHTRLEASYVGNRGYHLESNQNMDVLPLGVRQQCNPLEGGNGTYCDQLLTNPFYGLGPLTGTGLGASATEPRSQLALPYPQFTGVTQYGMNLGKSWYNGLQLTYTVRATAGLNASVGYTFSKVVEQGNYAGTEAGTGGGSYAANAYLDPERGVLERSVAGFNMPNVLKLSTVWQIPVGKGRHFLGNANRFVDAVLGGWQHTFVLVYGSGKPWTLPTNMIMVRNPREPGGINWNQSVVQGVYPCVAQMAENGALTLENYSASVAGCSLSTIDFVVLPPYAPPEEPTRTDVIRQQTKPVPDMSLSKTFSFTERMKFQFRAEWFNILNSYSMYSTGWNTTLTGSSFGQITPGTAGQTAASTPRYLQFGFRFLF